MKKFNNNLVIQSNDLVEARFTTHMTEQEQKTLMFIISETKKSDVDLYLNNQNKIIEISAIDFANIMKTSTSRIYEDASALSGSLTGKKFKVQFIGKDGSKAFDEISLISRMKYEAGQLTIQINSSALVYLIELKERFTVFRLENILRLGSSYAIKIYQLLKQYETLSTRTISIDELREILAIEYTYKLYSDFKRKVLEISKKHINLHTDIQIEYEEVKLGRKVHKIIFHIKSKINQEQQAKLAFELYIKNLSNNNQLKYLWEQTKPEYRWERFDKEFNIWMDKNVFYYEANSCDQLQYFEQGTLFYKND
ncbi:MAG TPA: replication initiation protein [Burkholderiales bacterium]|nr:replication initiation protein [Burkholderiales bacterium]